jgi:uncharacterized protein YndB with AHSA1/START domain
MATRHGTATVTLPSDTEILITRCFEAPRMLVWDALTTPRHLLRWWGPPWHPLATCEIDLRPGGSWRYVSRDAHGNELAWHGTYQEIILGARITGTEVFEPFPDAEATTRMTLAEADGVTTLQTRVRHKTRDLRDGHVDAGMEAGLQQTFDRLDDLLGIADTPAERFRRVAGRFGDRVDEVAPPDWDNPSPCEGWTARDVVRHLLSWVPSVIGRAEIVFPDAPTVDEDPVAAWDGFARTIQAALDDGEIALRRFDAGPGRARRRAGHRYACHRRRARAHLGFGPRHRPRRDHRRAHRGRHARRDATYGRHAARQRPLRTQGTHRRRRRRADQTHRLHRPSALTRPQVDDGDGPWSQGILARTFRQ